MALKTLRIVTKKESMVRIVKEYERIEACCLVVKLNIRRKSSSRQSAPL